MFITYTVKPRYQWDWEKTEVVGTSESLLHIYGIWDISVWNTEVQLYLNIQCKRASKHRKLCISILTHFVYHICWQNERKQASSNLMFNQTSNRNDDNMFSSLLSVHHSFIWMIIWKSCTQINLYHIYIYPLKNLNYRMRNLCTINKILCAL